MTGYCAEYWDYCLKGDKLYDSYNPQYEEAIECYEAAIKIDPEKIRCYNSKANCLLKLGRSKEAIECYDSAIRINPTHAAYSYKGDCLRELGRYEEAIECYEAAIKIDPEKIWCYNSKANCLLKLGRYEEAIKSYNSAIKIDPQSIWCYIDKGDCLLELGRYGEAIECYEAVIQIDPEKILGYSRKGKCLLKLGRTEEALACHEAAIRINPTDTAYCHKGDCLLELGRYEEAIQFYKIAASFDHDFDYAGNLSLHGKGVCLLEIGLYDAGINCFFSSISLNKDDHMAYHGLGLAYYFKGQYETAKIYLDRCLGINSDNLYAWLCLGKTLDKMHKYDEAIAALRKSLDCATKHRWAMSKISEIESEITRITDEKDAQEKETDQFKGGIQVTVIGDVNAPIKANIGGIQADDDAIVNRSSVGSLQTIDAIANEKRVCPKCGAIVEYGQRFCNICGSELK